MKLYFYKNNKKVTTYTYELLKYIAKKNNHKVVETPKEADLCCMTLTSLLEIDNLRIFRNRYKKSKIIIGGHACNSPAALLRYCDYVNLGQGFQFFSECSDIEDIEEKGYIVTREKRKGKFSQYINWDTIPLVQISKRSYSILYSVGCRMNCKFCLTSAINKYQVCPNKTKIYKAKRYAAGKQLYLITNDFDGGVDVKRNVSDIRVQEYLKNPDNYDDIKLLRLGVECVLEENRRKLGKNITDDELRELFKVTKSKNKRMNLFYMAGLETTEEWETMAELLDQDYGGKPKIGLILNYFDPQALTKMEGYDLTTIKEINIPHIKRILKLKSARILIFRDLKIAPYNAMKSSMLSRCNENQVDDILELKKRKHKRMDDFFSDAGLMGMGDMLKGRNESGMEIEI